MARAVWGSAALVGVWIVSVPVPVRAASLIPQKIPLVIVQHQASRSNMVVQATAIAAHTLSLKNGIAMLSGTQITNLRMLRNTRYGHLEISGQASSPLIQINTSLSDLVGVLPHLVQGYVSVAGVPVPISGIPAGVFLLAGIPIHQVKLTHVTLGITAGGSITAPQTISVGSLGVSAGSGALSLSYPQGNPLVFKSIPLPNSPPSSGKSGNGTSPLHFRKLSSMPNAVKNGVTSVISGLTPRSGLPSAPSLSTITKRLTSTTKPVTSPVTSSVKSITKSTGLSSSTGTSRSSGGLLNQVDNIVQKSLTTLLSWIF